MADRTTALRAGLTDHDIRRELSRERWREVHPGVYYLNVTPMTWRTEVMAATMAAGVDARASHRTAAVLYGFDGIYGNLIELTVPFSELPVPGGAIVHRTRRALPGAILDAIPITSPERNLMDLAALFGDRILEKATASAVHRGVVTIDSMDRAIAVYGGRGVRGTRRMRRVLRLVEDDRSGSPSEVDVIQLIRTAPIPHPISQLKIPLPTASNAYPDFSWPDRMRIVEIDGFGSHSTPDQLQNDLERQNQLMELGWEIRRFTARQVRRDPGWFLEELTKFVNSPFKPVL